MFAPVFPNSVHKFSYFLGCVWPTVFICSLKKKSHIRVTRQAIFNTSMKQLRDPSGTNMNLLESQGLSQAFVLSRQCHCLNTFSFMSPLSSRTEPSETGAVFCFPLHGACLVPNGAPLNERWEAPDGHTTTQQERVVWKLLCNRFCALLFP